MQQNISWSFTLQIQGNFAELIQSLQSLNVQVYHFLGEQSYYVTTEKSLSLLGDMGSSLYALVSVFHSNFRSQTNIRNTRQSNHLNILRYRLATGQRSFSYRGAKLWNNLSNDLKNVNSVKAFKSKLTKQLLLT